MKCWAPRELVLRLRVRLQVMEGHGGRRAAGLEGVTAGGALRRLLPQAMQQFPKNSLGRKSAPESASFDHSDYSR